MNKSDTFVNYFLSHRNVTNELVGKISKEDNGYKPTPTSMSARNLVTHMLQSFYHFAATAAKQQPKQLHADEENAELTELAKLYTDETVSLLETMADEDFAEIIDLTEVLGSKLPAEKVLNLAMDHEIHHKGSLFIYARELGHTDLPMFVKQG